MFDINEIVEFAKSKGFDINQSESLGINSFLELRPSEKLIKSHINQMKNSPDLFFKNHLNITLVPDQKRCLNKSRFFNYFLISGNRKSGMSTLTLLWAIKSAVLYNKSVVLVCPSQKIADSMFTRLLVNMSQIPSWITSISEKYRNDTKLKLNTGGSIDIIPLRKEYLLGKKVDAVIIDDVSQLGNLEVGSFYASVLPVLSSQDSEFIITSSADTPESNFFDDLVFKTHMGETPFIVDHLKTVEYEHLNQIK